jgi:hypothetical protein
MNHEEALINAFVRSAKRVRFIEFLRSPERRQKFLATLYHFRDLDPRYLVPIPHAERPAKNIAALLATRGAPSFCHVISTNSDLDGRDINLVEVLEQVVGFGGGTLISCIPGRLGYFEGESPNERFILERPPNVRLRPSAAGAIMSRRR